MLEGNIKGDTKKPIDGYMKIPGRQYPSEVPGVGQKKKKKATTPAEAPK